MSEQHPAHHPFEVEHEQPSNTSLLIWGVIVALVFFGSGAVISSVFYKVTDKIIYDTVLSPQNPALAELRAQENERLTTYGYATADKTAVRIPVERAMQLMLEEAMRK